MKKIIIIGVTLFSILGMGSCTNDERESEFDTVKPDLPNDSKEAIGIDTVTVRVNTMEVQRGN